MFLRFDLGLLAGPLLSVKGKMADLGGRDGGNLQDAERIEVSNRTFSLDLFAERGRGLDLRNEVES